MLCMVYNDCKEMVIMLSKIKSLIGWTVLLLAVFCLSYGCKYLWYVWTDQVPPPQAYLHHYVNKEPYIDGPPEFQQDIKKALATIEEVSPEQYAEMCSYAVQIKLINHKITKSGVAWADADYNQIYISDDLSVELNPYQLLTTLVHESKHLSQNPNMDAEQKEREAVLAEKILLEALDVEESIIVQFTNEQRFDSKWWEEERQFPASQ